MTSLVGMKPQGFGKAFWPRSWEEAALTELYARSQSCYRIGAIPTLRRLLIPRVVTEQIVAELNIFCVKQHV